MKSMLRLARMRKSKLVSRRTSLNLRLENFRLFRDSGWFKLAPLTCLVGRNSSGKSSILNAILLLKQSLEQEGMGRAVTPLTLSGPYVDLGNYADVVYDHDEKSQVSISLSMTLADLTRASMERGRPIVNLDLPRSRPLYGFGHYGWFEEKTVPKDGEIEVNLGFTADEPFGPSLHRFDMQLANIGSASFVRTVSGQRREHWRVYTSTLPPRSFALRSGTRAFFPRIDIRQASFRRCPPKAKRRIREFVAAGQLLFTVLQQTMLQSDVIGPFRTPPERRYAFGGFSASRSGPSGEQAIDLLITEALVKRDVPRPLHTAVSFWIKHLKLAKSLDIKDIAKRLNLFEVDVKGAGRGTAANLVDVGFGVSQVLPVLVQGLLMKRGGIYLVQQPEIHLHPDAQAGLADFFMYLASYGVITIVETHSEYLLLRLRRRLAENARPISTGLPMENEEVPPLTKDDISVLFTGEHEGAATVRQLEIGDSFQFENLPPGFMSQALDDRVKLLKAIGKRNG
jgi:predicted ATPase